MTDFSATHASAAACPAPRARFGILSLLGLARQRRDLANLTEQQLEDVGISAKDAAEEAARPLWDVPHHWLR